MPGRQTRRVRSRSALASEPKLPPQKENRKVRKQKVFSACLLMPPDAALRVTPSRLAFPDSISAPVCRQQNRQGSATLEVIIGTEKKAHKQLARNWYYCQKEIAGLVTAAQSPPCWLIVCLRCVRRSLIPLGNICTLHRRFSRRRCLFLCPRQRCFLQVPRFALLGLAQAPGQRHPTHRQRNADGGHALDALAKRLQRREDGA